jgi:tetratricopeptide (TPR) repeat protein
MPSPDLTPSPLSVFISYSHRDEDYKDELVVHLATLKRQGKIRAWQDRDIEAGAEWDAEIKQQLEAADIILLLITPRFLASDYCFDLEMQRAVQRHDEGTARVIPIIIRPCDWQGTPFSKLQVVPKDAKPVTKWDDQDDAFLNVVKSIRRAVESLQSKKPQGSTGSNPPIPVTPKAPTTDPPTDPPTHFSTYNPATFTGRETETAILTNRLQGSCRILAIVGMTGIGKTALAERVIANLMDTSDSKLPYYRFSLDDRSLNPDFSSSGAALLRTLGEEPTLEDQKDPAHLVNHLLERLCRQPCRVQIDSLERLLRGNEQEGWSEFCDPLWLDLLQAFLAGTYCPSQLLLTSQDIPADLDTVASRYPQFWHCEPLQGLSPAEQRIFFQNLGISSSEAELELLQHIGTFYDGHPLVLQVVTEELRQPPFSGNVGKYWQHYEAEFTSASAPKANKLDRSRFFRRRVRQRVEQTIQRLPEPARQMLCACSVFRHPVPLDFWYAMYPDNDPYAAFDTLQDYRLIRHVEDSTHTNTLLVRQHNLIRSVAYSLLNANPSSWKVAESEAARLWLTAYQPASGASNLETVRGYLEAFEHYCAAEDFVSAAQLPYHKLPTGYELQAQLMIWSHFRELIPLQTKQCDIARELGDRQKEGYALGNLGTAHYRLGYYHQAIDFHQQCLTIVRDIKDRRAEGYAQGNLGLAYNDLGSYQEAITCFQKHLAIAQEIGDRLGEGKALGNLGSAHFSLGNYEQAITFHQQYLAIAQETGDRQGQATALINIGVNQIQLNDWSDSLQKLRTALNTFREIGSRYGEAASLKYLSELYQALGEVEVARQYAQQALALATELGIPLKVECEALVDKIKKADEEKGKR